MALREESRLKEDRFRELVYEALATERGGVQLYEAALEVVRDTKLKREWEKYLKQTRRHVEIVEELCDAFDLDTDAETPGSRIVSSIGEALVSAIRSAADGPDPAAAEIVAGECVTLAETKDHLNWKLLAECVRGLSGERKRAVDRAVSEVEEEEDEHLYHTQGWTRELWLQSLGMRAVVPPPEEQKDVRSAIGAARAEKARKHMKSEKTT